MIIDATDLIVGRLATVVAKKALLGESFIIVNCEKAVMTGNKAEILKDRKNTKDRGTPTAGPYYPKMPDQIVKRVIRGMLPYKKERGRAALQRIICYRGVPVKYKDQKIENITALEKAHINKLPNRKFITMAQIARTLGANV